MALALGVAELWWPMALCLAAVPLYTLLATRRVYEGRLWARLLRAGLASQLYLVMLTQVLSLVALWTLLF